MFSRKKIKEQFMITIPEPCSEDWNKMSVVDQEHRHCSSCEKLVVDFTSMSDDEIVIFLHHNKHKTCGRFTATQLGRDYNPLPESTRTSTWWKAAMLLPLSLFSKNAAAQQNDSLIAKDSTLVRNDAVPFQIDSSFVTHDSLNGVTQLLPDSAVAQIDSITLGDSTLDIPAAKQVTISVELVSISGSMVYGGFTPVQYIYNGGMVISPTPTLIDGILTANKKRRVQQESISETNQSLVSDPEDTKPKDDPTLPPLPEPKWYEAVLPSSLRPRRNG